MQIVQRLNNDFCLVNLLDNGTNQSKVECQIPCSLIKSRLKMASFSNANEEENDDLTNSGGKSAAAVAAAKRKGSFKKWLRSSHRKLTSTTNNNSTNRNNILKENTNTSSGANRKYSDSDTLKIKVFKKKFILKKYKIYIFLIKFFNSLFLNYFRKFLVIVKT